MTDALSIAVPLIASFEGFRSEPYQDQANVWTIGFGFTVNADGTRVSATTPAISREAATERLGTMVARIVTLVRGMVAVPATENQIAACTSFAFNEGTNALRTSTLLRLFNERDTANAALQFGAWLVNRRKAEAALFLKPDGATT